MEFLFSTLLNVLISKGYKENTNFLLNLKVKPLIKKSDKANVRIKHSRPFGENFTKSLQHLFNVTKENFFFKIVFYIKMSYTTTTAATTTNNINNNNNDNNNNNNNSFIHTEKGFTKSYVTDYLHLINKNHKILLL